MFCYQGTRNSCGGSEKANGRTKTERRGGKENLELQRAERPAVLFI